jgi:hypothetical protein
MDAKGVPLTKSGRDRAEGWTHAKLSGHQNEEAVGLALQGDALSAFAARIGKTRQTGRVEVGGLHEQSVSCILGGTTKSKTDMRINWADGTTSNVSIKKRDGGQLFLIGTERFMKGFEANFGPIPGKVQRALSLYIGGSEALSILRCLPIGDRNLRRYELRKSRLVWESLEACGGGLAESLLDWFKRNCGHLASFCFSRGLGSTPADWAEFIWYRNLIGESDLDELFRVEDLVEGSRLSPDLVKPGPRNGGSTILLPFGFLQWHQEQMQFHHRLRDIERIIRPLR